MKPAQNADEAVLRGDTAERDADGHFLYERGGDGVWRYANTPVEVPGAKDRTLADVVRPRQIGRLGDAPEAILVSLTEVKENPRLRWVLDHGTQIRLDDEEQFWVQWALWQEHADDPVAITAPERDGDDLERHLAEVERRIRFTRRGLDLLTSQRLKSIVAASLLGMTRRGVGETVGVSTGRVQQLVDDLSPDAREEIESILDAGALLATLLPPDTPIDRDAIEPPADWDRLNLSAALDDLVELGLLKQDADMRNVCMATSVRTRLRRRVDRRGTRAAPTRKSVRT
jgi:hypothetical protein